MYRSQTPCRHPHHVNTPAVTIQVREASDDVPASSVTANGEPRGEQHITMTSMAIESTDNVPGSSVTANGEPRGDPHISMSSSLGVEASDDVPASTTMSTSTAMVIKETPSAMHGTNRTNPPLEATAMVVEETPSAMHGTNRYNLSPVERSQLFNRTRVLEAEAEVVSLRSELTRTQRRADQLQQLLEEDQALHSSDKRTQLHLRYLNKCTHARTAKITSNICTVYIAACHHALLSYQQEQSEHPSALRDVKEEPGTSQGCLCVLPRIRRSD